MNVSTTGACHSEVAQLRAQIAMEYQAAYAGLHGMCSTAAHAIIKARLERLETTCTTLISRVGQEEAEAIIVSAIEGAPS